MINLMVYLLISEFFIVSIYKSKFKKEIIESLVKTINPEIAYKADGFVNESAFNASMHYGQSAHAVYGGEDLFHGIHNNVSFHLSHVSLKSGESNSKSSTYFGPFIAIRLNQDFESAMIAKPKEKAIDSLGSVMNINLGSLVNKSTYSGLDNYEGRHKAAMPGYDIFCVDHVIVDKLASSNHMFSKKLKPREVETNSGTKELYYEKFVPENKDALLEEVNDFVYCINTRSEPNVGGKAGAKALEIALQIEKKIFLNE